MHIELNKNDLIVIFFENICSYIEGYTKLLEKYYSLTIVLVRIIKSSFIKKDVDNQD